MPVIATSFPLFYLNSGKERQALTNGGFDIWQRGDQITGYTGARYTADRWIVAVPPDTLGFGIEKLVLDPAAAPIKSGIRNAAFIYQLASPAQTEGIFMCQRIPGCSYGNDGFVVLSFWAWSEKASKIERIGIEQFFGAGGGSSPPVDVEQEIELTLTSVPTRYSYVFALPSTVGKNIPAGDEDYLEVGFLLETGVDIEINITGVQLSIGQSPLPYPVKTRGEELAECLQYFERQLPSGGYTRYIGTPIDANNGRFPINYTPKISNRPRIAFNGSPGQWSILLTTGERVFTSLGVVPLASNYQTTIGAFGTADAMDPIRGVGVIKTALNNNYIDISAEN